MLPEALAYVRGLLRGLDAPWFLCGGWAIDAWLGGQTRYHSDVDITVFHHDQRAVFEHLPGWALVAHDPHVPDDTTQQWDGRVLDPPAHIHVPTLASPLSTSAALTHSAFEFEVMLVERTGRERIHHPGPWGLPTVAPEVVLAYKAEYPTPRPHDDEDFQALLPTLDDAQRTWLRGALSEGHPWLARL